MPGPIFCAQVVLVLVAAAAFAALLHALLVHPLDDGAISPDLPGGHKRARRAEHHHDKHVLHAQLAPGEQGSEGFEGGGVGCFEHASNALFICPPKVLNCSQPCCATS